MLLDHSFAREHVGDVHHARARWDDDDLLLLQGTRRFQPVFANEDNPASDDENKDQQRENRVADNDQRIAGAPRRSRGTDRKRHVIRLQSGAWAARCDPFRLHR